MGGGDGDDDHDDEALEDVPIAAREAVQMSLREVALAHRLDFWLQSFLDFRADDREHLARCEGRRLTSAVARKSSVSKNEVGIFFIVVVKVGRKK
jgi:hypothetical protein